jgi:hypothetical protein
MLGRFEFLACWTAQLMPLAMSQDHPTPCLSNTLTEINEAHYTVDIIWSESRTMICLNTDWCEAILESGCNARRMCTIAGGTLNVDRELEAPHSPIVVVA